jgi:hypothetical protein
MKIICPKNTNFANITRLYSIPYILQLVTVHKLFKFYIQIRNITTLTNTSFYNHFVLCLFFSISTQSLPNLMPVKTVRVLIFCKYARKNTQGVDKLCSHCLFPVVVTSLEQAVNNL